MLNKYIEHLVTGTNAKVYRLQKHGNESGFLSLGNLVCPLDSESQNTHTLKAMAFSAIVDELNLQYDDHELIKYVRGQSELNQNETFNAMYDRLSEYIDMLKVSKFFWRMCGVFFYLSFGSLALLYFSWWFILLPPFLYSCANVARRNHALRKSASMSILYELSETFANFCRKKGLGMDFPDDPSYFRFIVEGQGTKNMKIRLSDDKWDSNLISEIQRSLTLQKKALLDIKIQILAKTI